MDRLLLLSQSPFTVLFITRGTEFSRMKAMQKGIGYVLSIIGLAFGDSITAV
jgi:hypothetical protein